MVKIYNLNIIEARLYRRKITECFVYIFVRGGRYKIKKSTLKRKKKNGGLSNIR